MPKYHWKIQQGTDAWDEIRLGKFTASSFHTFLGNSQTKKDLLWEIVAERMFKDSDKDEYSSYAMERGKVLEAEARRLYQAIKETKVKECGFVSMDPPYENFVGCSPDGLIDEDGGLEIKSPLAKNFLQWTQPADGGREIIYIKPEYATQVQFNLLVTGRKWWDFMYYHPRGGYAIKRIYPDEEYQKKILDALTKSIRFVILQTGECNTIEQKEVKCLQNTMMLTEEPSSETKKRTAKKAPTTKAESTSTEKTTD